MDETFSLKLDENRTLWLTEISRHAFEEQDLTELESDSGLFVVLEDVLAGSFDVLAKVASQTAGQALIRLLSRSGRPSLALV